MLDKSKIKILLYIIFISLVYNFSFFKSIPLSNNAFLIIKENGIYLFNENENIIKDKYIFENENEKLSSKIEIENIYYFKYLEKQNCIFIFIKKYMYIFSLTGNFIKKCNFFNEIPHGNYLILPYKYKNDEVSNKYYYIFINIENKRYIIINYYEYNYIINKSKLFFKKEFYLPNFHNESSDIFNNNFSFQLIKDKQNHSLLAFFYISEKEKDLLFEIFEFNLDKKQIKILNSLKPIMNPKIEGSNIKSINNKENTKTLICSKNKQNINCLYYDSITNEFSNYTNFLNNCNPTIDSFSLVNFENMKNNYALYCISSKNEINIVELNEGFHYKNSEIIDINNKNIFSGNKDQIFNYNSIISHILNKYPFFIFEVVSEYSDIKKLRKLNGDGEGANNNPPGGDGNPSENSNNIDNDIDNSKDNNNEQGNKNGNSSDQVLKGNGQTKEGYSFDFDNKETNIPKGQIRDNKDQIMNNIKPGESYDLKGEGYEVKVAPIGQNEEGGTSIDFLSCEQKLREYYNLNESSILTVFQIETEKSSEKSLTNRVQYIVYDENNNQLNLTICSDERIQINYALKENSTLNLTMYSNFFDKGIDILNSSDSFFNDICYSYSDGGSDMILSDRISEIYQNYSLCDSGCDYEGIDTVNLTISCSCAVATNDTDDDEEEDANLKEIFLGLFEDSTFGVVKCYKKVFSFKNKNKNIGFWLFLIIIICHIPLYVLFFKNGINPIKKYIENEMEKYHYLEKTNEDKTSKNNEKNNENRENNKNNEIIKFDNNNFVKNSNDTMNKDENENTDKKINFVISNIIPKNEKIEQRVKIDLDNQKSNELIEIENNSKREETNNDLIIYNQKKEENEEKNKHNAYFFIQIDANNSDNNEMPPKSNYILDNYEYDTAVKYDDRTFWRILFIVMLSKDNILNTFLLRSPLESQPLRICLLFFAYTSDLALNTLFYFSDNISDKYHYTGNNLFWYTLFNNILISVISTVLSLILGGILEMMTNSKSAIENEFKKEEQKMRENEKYCVSIERKKEILEKVNKSLKCLKIKMIIFIVLNFIILLFFFYFGSSFCEVYQNTQTSWISDAIVSIIISFPIEIGISLVITIIYKLSLKYKWELFYKISMLLV